MKKFETKADFHARMRRIAGLADRPHKGRVGSYITVHCGDRVVDRRDVRHHGTVQAVRWSNTAIVQFDNGFFGEVSLTNLRKEPQCNT